MTMARASATRRCHAARELRGHQPRRAAQAHGMQLGQHELADQRLGKPGMRAHRKGDVFVDVFVGEQRAVLEQHAHALAQREQFLARHRRDFVAEYTHAAALGVGLPGDEPQQRGLAGARRAHERGDAAPARGDIQAVENRAPADGVAHIADLNNGIAGLRRRSVRILRWRIAQAFTSSGSLKGREG